MRQTAPNQKAALGDDRKPGARSERRRRDGRKRGRRGKREVGSTSRPSTNQHRPNNSSGTQQGGPHGDSNPPRPQDAAGCVQKRRGGAEGRQAGGTAPSGRPRAPPRHRRGEEKPEEGQPRAAGETERSDGPRRRGSRRSPQQARADAATKRKLKQGRKTNRRNRPSRSGRERKGGGRRRDGTESGAGRGAQAEHPAPRTQERGFGKWRARNFRMVFSVTWKCRASFGTESPREYSSPTSSFRGSSLRGPVLPLRRPPTRPS